MKHPACRAVLPVILFFLIAFGILPGPVLNAQNLSVSVIPLPVDQISITDLDFGNFHSARPFIALVLSSSAPTRVVLRLNVYVELANDPQRLLLAEAISMPFPLSGTKKITNVDLGGGADIPLDENASGVNPTTGKRVNEVLQTTGFLPFGTYTFEAALSQAASPTVPVATDERSIVIQNPSRVELLAPSTGTDWPNPFPVFQWSANTDEVILGVYEKLPGIRTPQEAITGVPNLQVRLKKINTYQYPPSGAGVRQLEPGKSYYWLVQGVVRSGTNTEELISSEIWELGIANQSRTAAAAAILNQLDDITGSQFQKIIARLNEMGFEPTGLVRYGGLTFSWVEFVQRVRSGELQITGLSID